MERPMWRVLEWRGGGGLSCGDMPAWTLFFRQSSMWTSFSLQGDSESEIPGGWVGGGTCQHLPQA